MTQEDVLLMIAAGAEGPYDLDQIRLMKGAFLVSQRDSLITRGLLQADESRRYHAYALTAAGNARVDEIARGLGPDLAEWFRMIGRYVTTRSFARLLDEIYAEFPDFAKHSVMRPQ